MVVQNCNPNPKSLASSIRSSGAWYPLTLPSMDTNSNSSSFFHQNPNPNGLLFSPNPNSAASAFSGRASAAPEPVKRKRGRPRKYGASLSSSSLSPPPSSSSLSLPSSSSIHQSSPMKKDAPSPKKAQIAALGIAGQGFTPHVITVSVGEDVTKNIMSFIQQSKRAVCILSACGSISNASLCQPAMLGGNVTYEGRFEILSLSGSFLLTETGGASTRTGGLNICLLGADGRIVGGGVGGPLRAASSVQVIVGSFLIDPAKNVSASASMDNSGSKMPAPVGAGSTIISPASLRSCPESSGRMTPSKGSNDHPSFGGIGSSFMLQSRGMPVMPSRLPTDWRGRPDTEHGSAGFSQDDEDEENFRD